MFHCLPNVIETINTPQKKFNHFWSQWVGGERPRWKVVTLSSVFFNPSLNMLLMDLLSEVLQEIFLKIKNLGKWMKRGKLTTVVWDYYHEV